MEKQTAVEWLVKEFSEILGPLNTKPMQDLLIVDAIEQAKAMEKEQIIEAYKYGNQSDVYYKPEQYYN